jgi:hypothetical protein
MFKLSTRLVTWEFMRYHLLCFLLSILRSVLLSISPSVVFRFFFSFTFLSFLLTFLLLLTFFLFKASMFKLSTRLVAWELMRYERERVTDSDLYDDNDDAMKVCAFDVLWWCSACSGVI